MQPRPSSASTIDAARSRPAGPAIAEGWTATELQPAGRRCGQVIAELWQRLCGTAATRFARALATLLAIATAFVDASLIGVFTASQQLQMLCSSINYTLLHCLYPRATEKTMAITERWQLSASTCVLAGAP